MTTGVEGRYSSWGTRECKTEVASTYSRTIRYQQFRTVEILRRCIDVSLYPSEIQGLLHFDCYFLCVYLSAPPRIPCYAPVCSLPRQTSYLQQQRHTFHPFRINNVGILGLTALDKDNRRLKKVSSLDQV